LLKQVFFNLVRNALEAMPAPLGGHLIVRMDADDSNVRVEVEDTGPGIPDDDKQQIFTPFFTTKPPGEGTGLGLALSYKIVSDHSGDIEIVDRKGGGTTFMVTFPIGG
jgi:signal transduction histidine kinase